MNWDEYLMGFARHAALKSKDSTQVGAALVLALTTALVTAGSHSAEGAITTGFHQFHSGLALVTGVALVGLAITASPLVRRP